MNAAAWLLTLAVVLCLTVAGYLWCCEVIP